MRGFGIFLYESALRKAGGALQLIADLTVYASSPRWDLIAQGWFGTATFIITAPLDVLLWLYDAALEYHVEIIDPFLCPRYEGMVTRLALDLGGVRKSRTLDEVWNQVRVDFGDHQYASASDSDSKTAWGQRRIVLSSGRSAQAVVQGIANRYLEEHKDPHGDVNSELGAGGESGMRLEFTCRGYWDILTWDHYRTRGGTLDSGKQIKRVLQKFEVGSGNNLGFLSTDYALIPATGNVFDMDAKAETGQQRILKLMNAGNASGLRLMGGVGRGRKFFTFARPQQLDYFYDPYETTYRDVGGAPIPKWLLEPGHFVYLQPPYPAQQIVGDPVSASNYCEFIHRVQYDFDQDHVTLESPDGKNILRVLSHH